MTEKRDGPEPFDPPLTQFFEQVERNPDLGRAAIRNLDRLISDQLNAILHHPEFQQLESAWRGLHYLVFRAEPDEEIRIEVLNVGKCDLAAMFEADEGERWDQSPLFQKVCRLPSSTVGAPFHGCLVGDYSFGHHRNDVRMLDRMAEIAASAQAPFVAAASPELLGIDSWRDLDSVRDVARAFQRPEYSPWRSLRETEDACYLCLCLPRLLARVPYGGGDTAAGGRVRFDEDVDANDHDRYVWMNPAYAMAANLCSAFREDGWCVRIRGIEGGGAVPHVPAHTFETGAGAGRVGPAEVALSAWMEAQLERAGLSALCSRSSSDMAVFLSAPSLQKPKQFERDEATWGAQLGARLPGVLALSRFAHYLRAIARDSPGAPKERSSLETWLRDWISQYVAEDLATPGAERARRPLVAVELAVKEAPWDPRYDICVLGVHPYHPSDGMGTMIRLRFLLRPSG